MLLRALLKRAVRSGRLEYVDPSGARHEFGDGAGPPVGFRLRRAADERLIALRPWTGMAEAYMDGRLEPLPGTRLKDLVNVLVANGVRAEGRLYLDTIALRAARPLRALAPRRLLPARDRRNISRHYDSEESLFREVLDPDRQYSCAYWAPGVDNLRDAQSAKREIIARKLLLDREGMRVLDIGSGWGGLGLELAARRGAAVEGLTLSDNQHRVSNERAREAGLADRCRFHLRDYRSHRGTYDRVVSVGMFEHVEKREHPRFFRTVAESLEDDGLLLLHTIGTVEARSRAGNPFVLKHVFGHGHIPTLSEIVGGMARAGLRVLDVDIWRLHYARTLEAWHDNLQARRPEMVAAVGESAVRSWELYLLGCAAGFRVGPLVVIQTLAAKWPAEARAPTTRDHMVVPPLSEAIRR